MKIAQAKSAAGPAARLRDAPIELGTTLRRERKTWQVNMPEEKKKTQKYNSQSNSEDFRSPVH
jgi:hypothetical protein